MISFWIKEDKIIWLALAVSLFIHALIFIFSGKSFIPRAQFSVQPSEASQTVEVSIKEIKDSSLVPLDSSAPAAHQNDIRLKQSAHSKSGVMVKANPDYYQNPSPKYPELAKQMHQEGLVMLAVDVDREGVPIKVEIKQSSGFRLLDQAAVQAVSHWKFQPGSVGNIPVESTVIIPIRFRLEK